MGVLRKYRVLISVFSLLLLSLLLLSISVRSRPYHDPIAAVVLEVFAPLQGAMRWVRRSASSVWFGYLYLVGASRENEFLRLRVSELEADLVRLNELEQSNVRLSELLRFRGRWQSSGVGARVIGRDPQPGFHSFVIDLGSRDHMRSGLAVVAPGGVVGKVTDVGLRASRVMLLTDNDSGIDAIVQRSRERGIVQGARDGGARMNYLRRDVDVVAGDLVITSGLDGIFPKGVRIGVVAEIRLEHRGLLHSAEIEPSVHLDDLEEVLVVDAAAQPSTPLSQGGGENKGGTVEEAEGLTGVRDAGSEVER